MLMCKHLAELLQAEQPLFSISLEQLERAGGNPSADVRLTAEIIGKAYQKTKELGLDPRDTTAQELYLALKELIKKHDEFLSAHLGVADPTDVAEVLPRLKLLVEHLDVPRSGWFLKHSTAKRLLKAMPPKKVMKQLNYRSVDSMLKREHVGEIFAGVRCLESAAWQEVFLQKYRKLSPQAFESRKIEIIQLDHKKWGDCSTSWIRKKHHNITQLKELGVVVILPMPVKKMRGITIAMLPLLLHYLNEVRLYSALFKMRQISSEFGNLLTETLANDPANHANMGGKAIHWRVMHRYFGSLDRKDHPEIFEPHLQPEDLHWRKVEDVLYRIEPALHFWRDMDFVAAVKNGHIISFNLMDVAASYINDLPFGQQANYHFRDSLWNEIYVRYLGQKSLESQVLKQLEPHPLVAEAQLLNFGGVF